MQTGKMTIRFGYGALILLSLIGIGIVVRRTILLVPILVNGYRPAVSSKPASPFSETDAIFAHYPFLTLIHIVPALLFVTLGPIQFSRKIRRNYPAWHRRSGRIFLLSSTIIGLTALLMSLAMPSIGGFNQAAATTLFSIFFLVAIYKAFRHIRQRNIALHREWIIRAYAIGLAVATIRLVNAVLFATSSWSGLTIAEFFGTGFWLGFVLHLIVAEVWIDYTQPGK
ncbi:DUF2306 domain-containing protein [Spirosoma jeollabukense]